MPDEKEAKILSELADKLAIWQDALARSDKKHPPVWSSVGWRELADKERQAAIHGLVLLRDNADLFCQCQSAYRLELDDILRELRDERFQLEYSTHDLSAIAVPGFISELRRWAGMLKNKPPGKEQPWDKDNPNYMPISDAVKDAKRKGRRVSVTTLSRSLTPDGEMRYMRKYTPQGKPSRCRVHIGDFRQHRKTLASSDDPFSEEAFKARQEDIRKQKVAKGTGHETKSGGLDKLLGDIETR